ncbi:metal-dependent hydrolase [Bacillus methanolicus PB1]|uniref:Metal-dependent hydrolase n=2 Tax=Bacillus methanolicus TaxID=1471 RepID=I3E0E2_BACMT|nr:metal-dependent hydrolase [Bacillus methanolicus PB1]
MNSDPKRMTKEQWEAFPEQIKDLYSQPPKIKVTKTLKDNQFLPICGGIKVISTPGHTPGHISLYLEESKILFAGDAMVCSNGILKGPVKQTTHI